MKKYEKEKSNANTCPAGQKSPPQTTGETTGNSGGNANRNGTSIDYKKINIST
ncbi:MAG: hypothetical protein IJ440_01000 [Alphaproteobacteria bacterium]|nr:hypothetical protein [Alphaproteobacteria bacterium]